MVKKTLLKKALETKGLSGTLPELPGEVAMAYLEKGDDQTITLRTLNEFAKKLKEKFTLLGGVIQGTYLSKVEANALANIPAPQVLRGMFVNVINSPIQRFAIALGEIAKQKA